MKKLNNSRFKKENIPWNKGLTKETDERIKRIAEGKIGKKRSKETIRKMSEAMRGKNHPFYGEHRSEETKQKISQAKLNKNPENLFVIFTEDCKQVLLGSLLGDGNLSCGAGRNYYFEETHSISQRDYLIWKNEFLKIFDSKVKNKECKNYKLNKIYYQFKLQTSSLPLLTNYYKEFYLNGRKRILLTILNQLNELGLTIWYLDDGHVALLENLINFSTDSYTYREHNIIKNWFIRKWKLYPIISKRNKSYYLRFNKKDSEKLLTIFKIIFEKYKIPSCMLYKLGQFWEGNKSKIKLLRKRKNKYKKEWRKRKREIREREKLEKLKKIGENIKKLYYGELLTLSEVGKKLGYSHAGIIKIMKKLNIPRRTAQETKKLRRLI